MWYKDLSDYDELEEPDWKALKRVEREKHRQMNKESAQDAVKHIHLLFGSCSSF
jgi:hypothetical protein